MQHYSTAIAVLDTGLWSHDALVNDNTGSARIDAGVSVGPDAVIEQPRPAESTAEVCTVAAETERPRRLPLSAMASSRRTSRTGKSPCPTWTPSAVFIPKRRENRYSREHACGLRKASRAGYARERSACHSQTLAWRKNHVMLVPEEFLETA